MQILIVPVSLAQKKKMTISNISFILGTRSDWNIEMGGLFKKDP